jgi:hypothetical protein
MVILLGVLGYGLLRPKTPSAFDSPAAQMNSQGAPWNSPHAY